MLNILAITTKNERKAERGRDRQTQTTKETQKNKLNQDIQTRAHNWKC